MSATATSRTLAHPLTTNQAAEHVGVAPATLRYWRHCGTGPRSYTVGTAVRYDLADLQAWLEHQKATTAVGGIQ